MKTLRNLLTEQERPKVPKKGSEIIDIAGEIKHETEKAYRFFDGSKLVWLPKSQVEWDPDSKTMTMPVWLATERELV